MKAYYLRFGHTFAALARPHRLRTSEAKVSTPAISSRGPIARGVMLGLVAATALLGGCKKNAPAPQARDNASDPVASVRPVASNSTLPVEGSAARASSPAAGNEAPRPELAITWDDPPEWERVTPKSRMRLAQYIVKPVAPDTEPGEVTLFHFGPNMGGGVEENITRWTNQFSGVDPKAIKRTTKTNGDLSHHLVQVESGQFQSSPMMGGPAEPKPNYGLLGVVTEAPSGKYFFKLTGPSKTVAANVGAFEKLVDSIKNK